MGWLFTQGLTRKEMVEKRTKAWQNNHADGTTVTSTCIAHCYRGCAFSGVLWTVWERTFIKDGVNTQPTERWIGCDLLQYQTNYGWGYKDMEESCGPCTYSCPLGYFAMVPIVANEGWRETVRAYHACKKAKRAAVVR